MKSHQCLDRIPHLLCKILIGQFIGIRQNDSNICQPFPERLSRCLFELKHAFEKGLFDLRGTSRYGGEKWLVADDFTDLLFQSLNAIFSFGAHTTA